MLSLHLQIKQIWGKNLMSQKEKFAHQLSLAWIVLNATWQLTCKRFWENKQLDVNFVRQKHLPSKIKMQTFHIDFLAKKKKWLTNSVF